MSSSDIPAGLRVFGWSRYLMLIAVIGCLGLGIALLVHTAIDTVQLIAKVFDDTSAKGGKVLALGAIEQIDRYLIAAVAWISAIGLGHLFVDERIPAPAWLRITSLDALKDKLMHVVVLVIAVLFVGQAAAWSGDVAIAAYGGAIAAVIGAIAAFVALAKKDKQKDPA